MARHPEPDEDVRTDSSAPAETGRMREVDLDTVVRRQAPTRTRLIQVGVLLTSLLVVGGLVFRGYQAGQPQPTTGVGDDVSMNVVIFSNVNHGTLIVNGKKLDVHPPVIVTLRPGTNTISISAPPFRQHTCTVDLSRPRVVAGGQCDSAPLDLPMDIGGKKAATRVEMPLTLTDLPAEHQHSVEAVVAQALDASVFHTAVPAHQFIATGVDAHSHITSRLTDTELQAAVAFVRRASQANQSDDTCVENICAGVMSPDGPSDRSNASSTADTVWMVATFFTPQWHFTTHTGKTAALSSLTSAPDNNIIFVRLHYAPTHGWSQWDSPGFLNGGASALDVMVAAQLNAAMTALSAYDVTPVGNGKTLATRALDIGGCDVQFLDSSGTSTGHFIWRFGVLLAADAAAHKLVPSLPVAPQAEIDAVTKQA